MLPATGEVQGVSIAANCFRLTTMARCSNSIAQRFAGMRFSSRGGPQPSNLLLRWHPPAPAEQFSQRLEPPRFTER